MERGDKITTAPWGQLCRFLLLLSILLIGCFTGILGQATDSVNSGTFIDSRDGHAYKWIKVGSQTWMAENLAYLPKVTPVSENAGFWVYGYMGTSVSQAKETANYRLYGCLYSLFSAWAQVGAHEDVCPKGWRLPSDEDWMKLEKQSGMDPKDFDEFGFRVSGKIGSKLKSLSGWGSSSAKPDILGFSVLPGGSFNREANTFQDLGKGAAFITTTFSDMGSKFIVFRAISKDSEGVGKHYGLIDDGYSVRCIKNITD